MQQKKYGLFTSITMIVGIVIGSGIFFKSDNILIAPNGNILLGIILFFIAAMSIIFGSLTIAELASKDDKAGGIITYIEMCIGKTASCAIGWFQTFLYYPTIIAVVSWVTGIYTIILFNLKDSLELQVCIGTLVILALFIINILSAKLGGYLQNAATIIKLIPLILIGVCGFIFGNPSNTLFMDNTVTSSGSYSLLAALSPILFSFDGWIIATSLSHEIKNAKRNLPIALIISPLMILGIYLVYFLGISLLLTPTFIMEQGDAHVYVAANRLFGIWGGKIIIIFIIISVLGTVNGVIMGIIRQPYSLAIRNMFPKSQYISKVNPNYGISVPSAIIALCISLVWMFLHYITQKYNILPNSDVSEIPIAMFYVFYIILYVKVLMSSYKDKTKNFWRRIMNPVLATTGSVIILIASMQSPLFITYVIICSVIIIFSVVFWNGNKNKALKS